MREVLQLLRDGEFHSGEALGALLGVSRAAVWKRLEHLEAELGLVIHRVRGRGYRLASPLSLLDREAIVSASRDAGWNALVFDSLDSTNAEVLRRLAAGEAAPHAPLSNRYAPPRRLRFLSL
jgi:BirA family biotin operon repressor/biotin-[acetyl-CoA-carboxylase] ligase